MQLAGLTIRPINFISTVDSTDIVSVEQRIKNEKVEIPAPTVMQNYNMYMGGVDYHDKYDQLFFPGKHHKFKKYYIKLMFLLIDVAMTNSWIYYKVVNSKKCKHSEARVDFILSITQQMPKIVLVK